MPLTGCGNAAGNYIPPYFIFPCKKWCEDLLRGTNPNAADDMSKTG